MNEESGDLEILAKAVKERVVREHDLSHDELLSFNRGIPFWIDCGMVSKVLSINQDSPPEREFHYLPTEKGIAHYLSFITTSPLTLKLQQQEAEFLRLDEIS